MKRLVISLALGLSASCLSACGPAANDADSGTVPVDAPGSDATADSDDGGGGGEGDGGGTSRGPTVVSLSAGHHATCAALDDGTVRCWGDNRAGQLGDGTMTSSTRPVNVSGLSGAVQVSVGYEYACARLSDGTAQCWGSNSLGQLGDGTTEDRLTPVAVMGLTGIAQIEAGNLATCALTGAGTVFCWGRGGDLGDGGFSPSSTPQQVPDLVDVAVLSVAPNATRSTSVHVCGTHTDGTAFCWGGNDAGQLGDGTQDPHRVPNPVMGIDDATSISAGGGHACALRGGAVSCWGEGVSVGDGTVERRFSPTPAMTGATPIDAIEAGNQHTCARTTARDLVCWGANSQGQCGDGAELVLGVQNLVGVPALVTGVVLFSAGAFHTCAFTAGDVTWCWGENEYGEIGSGTASSSARSAQPAAVVW